MTPLLPHNASRVELALEAAGAVRVEAVPAPAALMWDPARCPPAFLLWLAWALSVDDWDNSWSDEQKRAVIAGAVDVHRHKGTLGGMKRALVLSGYGDAVITEGLDKPRLGREWLLGRDWRLGPTEPTWADYWVALQQAVPKRAADRLAAYLQSIAPVRCRLRQISLSGVRYVLGREIWTLGDETTLGGIYIYEVS